MKKKVALLMVVMAAILVAVPAWASEGQDSDVQMRAVFEGEGYSLAAFNYEVGDMGDFYTIYKDGVWYAFEMEATRDAFFEQLMSKHADEVARYKQDEARSAVQFTVFYDGVNYSGFAAHVYNGWRVCGSQLGSLNDRADSAVSYTSWYTKMWTGNCSGTSHVLWAYSQIPNMDSPYTPIGRNNMSGVRTCPYTTPVGSCN